MPRRESPSARFARFVSVQPNGCHQWTGAITRDGYGLFNDGERIRQAHRFAYTGAHGEVPYGLHLDHLCRNRGCVNPAHLEAVTPRENVLRGRSLAAQNAKKTHCPKGHPFDERSAKTFRSQRFQRRCLPCLAAKARARRASRRITIT